MTIRHPSPPSGPGRDAVPVASLDVASSDVAWPRTAATLRALLLGDLTCRRRWQRHAQRSGAQLPNQAGVAWVLALTLWDRGDVAESRRTLPRSLKDRVSRALSGHLVSASTLALFVEAFDLSEEQEAALYDAWEEDAAGRPAPADVANS